MRWVVGYWVKGKKVLAVGWAWVVLGLDLNLAALFKQIIRTNFVKSENAKTNYVTYSKDFCWYFLVLQGPLLSL